MKALNIIFLLLIAANAGAQQILSGRITDKKGEPVKSANIYFEGSYEGCISDSAGHFFLSTTLSGEQIFTASFIGYEKYSRLLYLTGQDNVLEVELREKVSEINEVSITAGVFSASDEKKSATLTSFDITTTASALGDIYGAYATMPGSQKVGEEGMLFVRGGESYETKTYMDGMMVQSPYFSSMPNVPTRGRFSPLLFSETLFSTGGYSAEYGHALSSVVDLTTNGLETGDKASVAIMTVGASASMGKRREKNSVAISGLYANNALHHRLFKQNVDWIKDPVLGDGMIMFRQQVGESGLLKSFCSFNAMTMEMNYDNFEAGTMDPMQMNNLNLYANTSYSDQLSEKWLIRTGFAYSRDSEKINYDGLPITSLTNGSSLKLALTHLTSKGLKIRFGGDIDDTYTLELTDISPSLFVETDLKISHKLALRTGLRAEYTTLLKEPGFLPRVSAAYKTGTYSQVSFAWGKYRQKPINDILQFAPQLSHEKADHYILNFQYRKQKRTFRIEAYLKKYDQLVKYSSWYSPLATDYNNEGYGKARGLDLFWRDSESLKDADYWISYSFLNTTRDYQNYPESAMPSFASAHNLSVVYKRFFRRLRTFVGATYSYASPRPYENLNSVGFMDGRTKAYNDLSLSLTYLCKLFRKDCIIHMSITNLVGFNNEFGYRYSTTPDEFLSLSGHRSNSRDTGHAYVYAFTLKPNIMKNYLLIISISLFTINVSGQENSYTTAMKSALQQMEQASEPEQYLDCAMHFERIATAEKSLWLPYYYASQCMALMSFQVSNGEEKDQVLDRAQELLDLALKLETDPFEKSELHVIQAFIYPSRIMVDPVGRGGVYFEKMFASLETAKNLNPDNPRSFFLEGTYKLNIPAAMGGGAEKAQPILKEALALYEAFSRPDPLWPTWGEETTRAELEKIQ